MIGPYGRYGRQQLVEFRRVHNQVQLLARNTDFVAKARHARSARGRRPASRPACWLSAPVASQPHPERKIDPGRGQQRCSSPTCSASASALQRAYRQGYALRRAATRRSPRCAASPTWWCSRSHAHYATAQHRGAAAGRAAGAPAPSMPRALPDRAQHVPRPALLAGQAARAADDGAQGRPARRLLRHRAPGLQRRPGAHAARALRQPLAAREEGPGRGAVRAGQADHLLARPHDPGQVPRRDRRDGILEWNKAFERIGFKDAIVVKVQPDDADFDTLDVGVASVRWMTNAQPRFGAIGPSHVDPRTGEILDADIGFESLTSRSVRALRAQVLASRRRLAGADAIGSDERIARRAQRALAGGIDSQPCQHADMAAEQLSYALDVLEARGDLDPDSPEAQQFVLRLPEGHDDARGRATRSACATTSARSRIYTDAAARRPRVHARERHRRLGDGVRADQPAAPGRAHERHGTCPARARAVRLLGDRVRLQADRRRTHEKAELQRIAARSSEPQLAYGTDEDNFLGVDPESLHFDLGNDPVAFAKKRIDIARDLIRRQETRAAQARRGLLGAAPLGGLRAARRRRAPSGILARQIGGVRTLRDFPGSGRDPLMPVPARRRSARRSTCWPAACSRADSFVLSPTLQRRLAPTSRSAATRSMRGDGPVADRLLARLAGARHAARAARRS